MFSKMSIGQLCGFLYLFILLTTMLSKFMAGAPLDPEAVSSTIGAVAEGGVGNAVRIFNQIIDGSPTSA